MNSTPRTRRAVKRWSSTAVVIGSTVAVLASPLAIGTASAAPTSVTITSGAGGNAQVIAGPAAPATLPLGVSYTPTPATPIDYAVSAGPDAVVGNPLPGTLCTAGGAGAATCHVTNTSRNLGQDSVIVFADNNGNGVFDSGDVSTTTTVTFSGPPSPPNGAITIVPVRNPATHTLTSTDGTCEVYKVSAFDNKPEPSGGVGIAIEASEVSQPNVPGGDVFKWYSPLDASLSANGTCMGAGDASILANTSPDSPVSATTHTQNGFFFVITGDDGTALIGLKSSAVGTGIVRACNTNACVAPTTFDVDNVTWTAGGANSVTSLAASSNTSGYTGTSASFTVTANSNGNPVQGVVVSGENVNGPSTTVPVACGTTDQNGQTTCSLTNAGTTGTDNLKFWVDTNSNGVPDAGEQQATASATFNQIPAYTSHTLTCVQQLAGAQQGQGVSGCTAPTTQNSIVFTETLKNNGAPVSGAIITFNATAATLGGAAVSPANLPSATATTDTNGVATFTVSDPSASAGDSVSVSAKIGNTVLDTATGAWQASSAVALSVTPQVQSVTKGGGVTVNARVVDQFGAGVATSNTLGYGVTGRNTRAGTISTDSTGAATLSYTDVGTTPSQTSDSITITDNTVSLPTGTATVNYINGTTTAATVTLDTSGNGISDGSCNAAGHVAATNVALAHQTEVCAVVKNSFSTPEVLAGKTVVFTVSNGQVAAHGALASGSTTSYTATTDPNGVAFADVTSTKSGAQTVTATSDSVNGTGTVTYAAPAVASARNIAVAPALGKVTAGTQQKFTFTVTDQYGNGVPSASVVVTQTGTGVLTGGNATVSTAPDGTASVLLSTQATDVGGSGSVTGNISGGNACGSAAGNPAGTTAGMCTAVATYTVAAPIVPNHVKVQAAPFASVGHEELVAATVTNSDGTPAANVVVRYRISGANSASGAAVTKANGNALFGFLPKHAGTVNVVAYTDLNDDQLRQTTEPQGTLSFSIAKTVEKPTLHLTSAHGAVTVHVTSHPSLSGAKVTYYVKHLGNFTKIGAGKTGSAGHASQTFVETAGVRYTYRAKVTGKSGVTTGISKSKSIKAKK